MCGHSRDSSKRGRTVIPNEGTHHSKHPVLGQGSNSSKNKNIKTVLVTGSIHCSVQCSVSFLTLFSSNRKSHLTAAQCSPTIISGPTTCHRTFFLLQIEFPPLQEFFPYNPYHPPESKPP